MLMTIGRSVVLLTTTLPAVDEARLFQRLQLNPAMVQRFRSPRTTRVNIVYRVQPMNKDMEEDAILAFYPAARGTLASHRRKNDHIPQHNR